MDVVVAESAQRCTLSPARIAHVASNYIGKTSGLSYQDHFEKMIVAVVGYRSLEHGYSGRSSYPSDAGRSYLDEATLIL